LGLRLRRPAIETHTHRDGKCFPHNTVDKGGGKSLENVTVCIGASHFHFLQRIVWCTEAFLGIEVFSEKSRIEFFSEKSRSEAFVCEKEKN
jgi:hypothetical protein